MFFSVTKMEDNAQREVIPPRLSTYHEKFEAARTVPNLNVMGLSQNVDFVSV